MISSLRQQFPLSARCNLNGLGSLPRKSEPRNAAGYGMRFPGARPVYGQLLVHVAETESFDQHGERCMKKQYSSVLKLGEE
jgi:hypothetical protein